MKQLSVPVGEGETLLSSSNALTSRFSLLYIGIYSKVDVKVDVARKKDTVLRNHLYTVRVLRMFPFISLWGFVSKVLIAIELTFLSGHCSQSYSVSTQTFIRQIPLIVFFSENRNVETPTSRPSTVILLIYNAWYLIRARACFNVELHVYYDLALHDDVTVVDVCNHE